MIYQFIIGISFELVFIILFSMAWLSMNGKFRFGWQGDDFEEWKLRNGVLARWLIVMTVVLLVASIIAKYIQFFITSQPPQ